MVIKMNYKRNNEKSLSDGLFKNPPAEYRGFPFWGWNCELDRNELFRQIKILKEMGFGGFYIHSRTGLSDEYLGRRFMDMVKACAKEAEAESISVGLYDEDRWPSGSAGGIVTRDKRYRQRYLLMSAEPQEATEDFNAAYENGTAYYMAQFNIRLSPSGELVSYKRTKEQPDENETKWYAYMMTASEDSWYNNQTYVDTMSKEAIDKFIEVTYDAYKNAVGEMFGSVIPTIFTDEPQLYRKKMPEFAHDKKQAAASWTPYLAELFEKKYGFDITDKLPEIFWELGGGKVSKARYLYHDFTTELFTEAFSDNLGMWCENNGIELTGHMLCEESLYSQASTIGEAMRAYRHFTLPGIDILCDNHEYTTAKQAQSASHQYGRGGVMSELYGVTGWNYDFRGHKAQGDWQAALGVTHRVLSVAWVSMKGDAKRDYPTSVNYQSSWYKEYPYIENHFARINTALTRGKPIVKAAVIHPIETYWLHFGTNENTALARNELDKRFHELAMWLLSGTIDFDYICESLLPEQIGEISDEISVGEMKYSVIIVADCETLRKSTLDILSLFANAGGKIIFVGDAPKYVNAEFSDEPKKLYESCMHIGYSKAELLDSLEPVRLVEIREADGCMSDNMCYQLRRDNDCMWLFIAQMMNEKSTIYESDSENLVRPHRKRIMVKGKHTPVLYDTLTGDIKSADYEIMGENTAVYYTFCQNDSLLLKLVAYNGEECIMQSADKEPIAVQYVTEPAEYELSEPNVLLLDIAEYRIDNEPFREREQIRKIQHAVRQTLGIPDDRAQPWSIKTDDSEHTVTLRYTFYGECEFFDTKLALEEAENSEIIFNGEKVSSEADGHFTDKSIKTVRLPKIVCGKNVLEITQPVNRKNTMEACYIIGSFNVKLRGTEGTVTSMSEKLGFGDIVSQGMPFYGANVKYSMYIDAPCDCSAVIAVRNYKGMLLKAELDSKELGIIAYAPYEVKANNISKGRHRLDITLFGNRNNCFGPVHITDDKLLWEGPDAWKFMHDGKARWKYEYELKKCGILAGPEIRYYK